MKDVWIITSVIHTSQAPWTYTTTRSAFTPAERMEQVLKTIKSIRDLPDNNAIVLVECSAVTHEETECLAKVVDVFINLYDIPQARALCHESPKKSHGEAYQTLVALQHIKLMDDIRTIYKITGRYWINERFDKSTHSKEAFTFSSLHRSEGSATGTVLYGCPMSLIDVFESALKEVIEFGYTNGYFFYELILPHKCNPKHYVEMGVEGLCGVDRSRIFF